jgi:uncharacterized membrane protein
MDDFGNYKEPAGSKTFLGKLKMVFSSSEKQQNTIGDLILSELENVETAVKAEKEFFTKERLTEREKGKRLLFLFQKDLMPGINGMILESKDKRDALILQGTSRTAKILSWAFLVTVNGAMLFYIMLFALSQDSHRQQAWGQSFALWLVVEVFLVSTVSVLLMQVLIPSLTMKDVGIIKKKLIVNVISFYKEMARNRSNSTEEIDEGERDSGNEGKNKKVFNSAEYLFISNRLAHFYSELKIAKMVLGFQTPWPKQSYQHITDTSKKYDRKFSALQRSLSIVVLFFLTSLLSVPISVQDMIIQCSSTVTIGYTVLFHLRLYQIFPVLIVVPTIFLGVIIHFMIQSNNAKKKVEDSKLMKEIKTIEVERKNAYQITTAEDDRTAKEDSNAGWRHKKRRESIQKGIKVAQQIETVLHRKDWKATGVGDDDNESFNTLSDDFFPSNEGSYMAKYYNDDPLDEYAEEEEEPHEEEKNSEDEGIFPSYSPGRAFAYLAQRSDNEVDDEDNENYYLNGEVNYDSNNYPGNYNSTPIYNTSYPGNYYLNHDALNYYANYPQNYLNNNFSNHSTNYSENYNLYPNQENYDVNYPENYNLHDNLNTEEMNESENYPANYNNPNYNEGGDYEEEEDLFNLHLAKENDDQDDHYDEGEEEDELDSLSRDDSLHDELKTEAAMKLVSLSNNSLAAKLLLDQSGFDKRRRRSRLFEELSPIQQTTIPEHEEEQEEDEDNFSSVHLPPLQPSDYYQNRRKSTPK